MKPDKSDKNKPAGPPKPEQGALGDLLESSTGPHVTDSTEPLNPVRRAPAEPAQVAAKHASLTPPAPSPVEQPAPTISVSASAHPVDPATAAPSFSPSTLAPPRVAPAPTSFRASPLPPKVPGLVSTRVLMMIAVAISLLIHITIGVVIGKSHIGSVDIALIEQGSQTYRVRLPSLDDPIYRDPVLTAAGIGPATSFDGNTKSGSSASDAGPSAGELSKAMLIGKTGSTPAVAGSTNTSGTPGSGTGQTNPNAAPHEHPDVAPKTTTSNLIEAPSVELPSDIITKLAGGVAVETPGIATSGAKLPSNPNTGGSDGPSTSNQARSILKNMTAPGTPGTSGGGNGFGTGNAITIPSPAAPTVADGAPQADRRLLESQPVAPPIEVTAIALQEAKAVDIPEKLDDDFDYLVTKFRPQIAGGLFENAKSDRYTYFKVDISAKRSLRKLKTMPKDVVFLIDTSGSVPQDWVNSITRGVKDALGTLNEGDRFNIVFFSEKTRLFSDEKIQPVDAATIASAQQFLTGAKSGGDTDINRSLARLLVRDTSNQRAYYLVFISDGIPTRGVMDTRELINLVTRDNDLNASIYCVGVGNNQNRELLNFLAYRNKGASTFVKEAEQSAGAVRDLMSRIRYPIIKDVNLNVIGLDLNEVFPHNLPNIHQGETFSVYGRYEVAGLFNMRVGGHNGVKSMDVTFGGDLLAAKVGEKTIPEDWAFWKLHHIYSEMIRQGEKPELKAKIEELKKRFDLKTLY